MERENYPRGQVLRHDSNDPSRTPNHRQSVNRFELPEQHHGTDLRSQQQGSSSDTPPRQQTDDETRLTAAWALLDIAHSPPTRTPGSSQSSSSASRDQATAQHLSSFSANLSMPLRYTLDELVPEPFVRVGPTESFDFFSRRHPLPSQPLPWPSPSKEVIGPLQMPPSLEASMRMQKIFVSDVLGYRHDINSPEVKAHPLAAGLAALGYYEPEEWERWRSNPNDNQSLPRSNEHSSVTGTGRDGRYYVARRDCPAWPLPLPLEPYDWFVNRQCQLRGQLSAQDHFALRLQFWWRELNDVELRYHDENRIKRERAGQARLADQLREAEERKRGGSDQYDGNGGDAPAGVIA